MTGERTIGDILREVGAPDVAIARATTDRSAVQLGRSYVSEVDGDASIASASKPAFTVRCGRWTGRVTFVQHAELKRLLA